MASFSSTQIRVSHKVTGTTQNRTRLFLIGDDFEGVWTSMGNKKKKLSDLKEGETVQVTYYTDAIQHVDHARKIMIVNGFNLNINLTQTPAPAPHTRPRRRTRFARMPRSAREARRGGSERRGPAPQPFGN